jgi:hypothetical protein
MQMKPHLNMARVSTLCLEMQSMKITKMKLHFNNIQVGTNMASLVGIPPGDLPQIFSHQYYHQWRNIMYDMILPKIFCFE